MVKELIQIAMIIGIFIVSGFLMGFPWEIAITPIWALIVIFIFYFIKEFIRNFKTNVKNEQIARKEKEEESKKAQ